MPGLWVCLLLIGQQQAEPQVEVTTLSGPVRSGQLRQIDDRSLTLIIDGRSEAVPITDLLDLRMTGSAETAVKPDASVVFLTDGSRLQCDGLTASGQTWQVQHPQLGPIAIPRNDIRSLRLAADDPAISAAWKELVGRDNREDLIVIRKGDVLDHIDGVVGSIDDASVKFLLDGDDVTVKRERVFGIILAAHERRAPGRTLRVELPGGDSLFVQQVAYRDGRWKLDWLRPQPLEAQTTAVRGVDFSAGKVLSLSAIEPREVEHTPYFNTRWDYQRDRNLVGRPLRVGPRSFPRGLAIHSKTRLRYRLGGEYRRFSATLGLDPEISAGVATFRVVGDGRPLFESDVSVLDEPKQLDLSVEGVVELDLIVDFGPDGLDTGDRVHLGDAKVSK
uniref:Glycosyl hydrolase family 98 putative carbohydrate-binding module domain-containing protein n=1 Tax=Schlesneria paludicola TaxID=360056 RepID=A0A7C2K075_9PLAN